MYLQIRSRHSTHNVLRRAIKVNKRTVLRLGSTTDLSHLRPYEVELNPIEAIKISSNKRKMKEAFDRAGISHPKWISLDADNSELESFIDSLDDSNIIAKQIYGSRNRGNTYIDLTTDDFDYFLGDVTDYSNYIIERYHNYAREYRLHISKNGCFHAIRKLRSNDSEERWYFNNHNGLAILPENPSFNKPETWDSIVEDCMKASKEIGLDLAAYDVRVAKDGRFKIIECNSAPGLGNITTNKYIEELNNLCSY